MIENLDILYTVTGQSLSFDCPEGVPSSITSTVYENSDSDDATAESATTGSAAASTVSTTFDGNAGDSSADPLLLPLAATTGIAIGDRYMVTDASGEVEFVEVREITSGVSVGIRHNLKNDYVSGDTFKGTQIAHDIDATWVADENNLSGPGPNPRYRWRLQYTAGGIVRVHHVYFDLVRYSGTTTVTGVDVDRAYPWLGWMNNLSVEDREDRGDRVISEAYRQVKLQLHMHGKADQGARNREVMEDLVMHRAALLVAGRDFEARAVIEANETKSWNNFIIAPTPGLDFDEDGSGAATQSSSVRVFRR